MYYFIFLSYQNLLDNHQIECKIFYKTYPWYHQNKFIKSENSKSSIYFVIQPASLKYKTIDFLCWAFLHKMEVVISPSRWSMQCLTSLMYISETFVEVNFVYFLLILYLVKNF